jgi:hypothetical protein
MGLAEAIAEEGNPIHSYHISMENQLISPRRVTEW